MSSVSGLKARPEQRDLLADQRAEVLLSLPITRRFCSSLTSITALSSWKW